MRLRSVTLVAALVACAANPLRAGAQTPDYCPEPTYNFAAGGGDHEYVASTINGHDFLFDFSLGVGTLRTPYFVGGGTYDFGSVTSSDGAVTALGVWVAASCARFLIEIPPYAEPSSFIVVYEEDWGYTRPLIQNYNPPDDEDSSCEWTHAVHPVTKNGGVRKSDIDCTDGGSSGGGAVEVGGDDATFYCVYDDYYDSNFNYLYSVLLYCFK